MFKEEFKSESDALRMNQFYEFSRLCKSFKVYILHIEKRRYGHKRI